MGEHLKRYLVVYCGRCDLNNVMEIHDCDGVDIIPESVQCQDCGRWLRMAECK